MGAVAYARVKTWVAGETLTASDLNTEFNNILNNTDCSNIDDYSTNATQMQAVTDPYPASVASLATTLAGEIERIRYLIKQLSGESYWYVDPDATIAAIVAGTAFSGNIALVENAGRQILLSGDAGRLQIVGATTGANGAWILFEGQDYGGASNAGAISIASVNNKDINLSPNGTGVVSVSTSLETDTIAEKTGAAGVTIDGFKIKDTAPDPTVWPAFSATLSGNQTVSSADPTKIEFDTETFDSNTDFDNASNYRFTPTVAGYYLVAVHANLSGTDAEIFTLYLYKNGSPYELIEHRFPAAADGIMLTTLVSMNGSTDYLEAFIDSGSDTSYAVVGGATESRFSATRIA